MRCGWRRAIRRCPSSSSRVPGAASAPGTTSAGGIAPEDLPDVGPLVPGPAQWARHLNAGYFLIWDLTKVVIAQAHGYCLAGGSELAAYCDLFVVADDALIGYPPVRDMSPPDNCWFPWHLPMRKAKEMIFTGDPLTGKQAAEYGLANYSVPADELEEFTTKLAQRVALVPPALLALSKRQVNRTYEVMGIRTALSAGNDIMALNTVAVHSSSDAREGPADGDRRAQRPLGRLRPVADARRRLSPRRPDPLLRTGVAAGRRAAADRPGRTPGRGGR